MLKKRASIMKLVQHLSFKIIHVIFKWKRAYTEIKKDTVDNNKKFSQF